LRFIVFRGIARKSRQIFEFAGVRYESTSNEEVAAGACMQVHACIKSPVCRVIFVSVVKELRALAMSAPSLLRIANWKGWMSHWRRNSIGNGMMEMGRRGAVGALDKGGGVIRKIKSETLRRSVLRMMPAVRQGTDFEGAS
jgi:hypothetical protein